MKEVKNWNIDISCNEVLQAQGVPAASSLRRATRLVKVAESAALEVKKLLDPLAYILHLDITSVSGDCIILSNGHTLHGELLGKYLKKATSVYIVACTISGQVEKKVQEYQSFDLVHALALDAAGTAAIEKLSTIIHDHIRAEEELSGSQVTIPLNPGMIGWALEEGQKQVFDVLGPDAASISLNTNCIMTPFKSLSFVIGAGKEIEKCGSMCELCPMHTTCKYSKLNLFENENQK